MAKTPNRAATTGSGGFPGNPSAPALLRPSLLFCLACILGACRHNPPAYTLTQILTPPASKPEIKAARKHPTQKKGCDVEAESFTVTWHGNTAKLAAKPETYYAAPAQSRSQGADPTVSTAASGERIYVDALAELEAFRQALATREDAGCFRDDEAAHLRQAITETFPFPPKIAAFLRFGTYTRTGFIDLTPGFVLRMVSPARTDPDVSFYQVEPANGPVRIVLASGSAQALSVPPTPAYFRYLYWTGGATHNFRTTILGVPERAMLLDATAQFLSDPDAYCAKPGAGIFCQSIAVTVGMNAGFYVQVNGKPAFVRLGGQVAEALSEASNGLRLVRGAPPPRYVTVRRMFHGKPIPIRVNGAGNILSLVAMPGDEITFDDPRL